MTVDGFKFDRTLEKSVVVILMLYFLFFIGNSIFFILYPYQIDYGEGFLLNQAKMISEGLCIYKDIEEPPYIIANYPPLYPFIVSIFIPLAGVSFIYGRIISFLSTLLVGFLIYKLVEENTNKKIGLLSSLLFFASPYIFSWGPLHRVDMLALVFAFLGIYFSNKESNKSILFSIPFFLASFFTKQSFLAAPIAVFIYLLFKNIRVAIIFGTLIFSGCVGLFITINFLTDGQFYLHTIIYNVNIFSMYQAISFLVKFIWTHGILIILAVWVLFITPANQIFRNLFLIYFIIALCFSITVGKVGAYINYFVEVIAVVCILCGISIKRLIEFSDKIRDNNFKMLVWILLLFQCISFAHIPFASPSLEDLNYGKILSSKIKNYQNILSEDGGILLINGKEILFQPFEFTQLSIQGIWDQRKIISEIDKKNFDLIVLEFNVFDPPKTDRFTPEMIRAIQRNYCIVEKLGKKYIYEPCK